MVNVACVLSAVFELNKAPPDITAKHTAITKEIKYPANLSICIYFNLDAGNLEVDLKYH